MTTNLLRVDTQLAKHTAKLQWQMLDDMLTFGNIQSETIASLPYKDAQELKNIYENAFEEEYQGL